jgi:FAD dependent oxidoreductase
MIERAMGSDPQGLTPFTVAESARDVPVYGAYEIVVLGGGPAGLAAAASAARHGRKTLLVERYGFLGGMGTAAGVTNFCGLHANVFGEIKRVVHGIADDLLGRIDRLGGLNTPHSIFGKTLAQAYDTAAYKLAADDLILGAGGEILFHALGASVVMEGDRIAALLVETKSGRRAIRGEIFIDASGDGDLAAWAGAPFDVGDADGNLLYPTTMFRLNSVDPARAIDAIRAIDGLMDKAERASNRKFPRKGVIIRPQKHNVEWRANVTQVRNAAGRAANATDAAEFSNAESEGRRQVAAYYSFLRTSVPGFEDAYIVDIPPQIGVRETRRVRGLAQMTGADVLSCASFDDTVGVNGWPLEKHVAGDVVWCWPEIPGSRGFNHMPYRMLVLERISNLYVAGRCASMDHDGHSAARVSGPCFVMGEAAATAAHLALKSQVTPAALDTAALQTELERNGAFLGRDLARLDRGI